MAQDVVASGGLSLPGPGLCGQGRHEIMFMSYLFTGRHHARLLSVPPAQGLLQPPLLQKAEDREGAAGNIGRSPW